jgi:hypothetical protein
LIRDLSHYLPLRGSFYNSCAEKVAKRGERVNQLLISRSLRWR